MKALVIVLFLGGLVAAAGAGTALIRGAQALYGLDVADKCHAQRATLTATPASVPGPRGEIQ